MPDALQNAYLILLGQIVLIATAVFFGVPYFLSLPREADLGLDAATTFYLVLIFCACAMMIVNILIGWSAVRASAAVSGSYNNKMFIIDLMIIVCFFAMNNIIMFSLGDTLSLKDTETIGKIIHTGVDTKVAAVTATSLYFLTSLFLLLCKWWNLEHYKSAQTHGFMFYEKMLWLIIVMFLAISIVSILFWTNIYVQFLAFSIWILGWMYINVHWIRNDFMSQGSA